MPNGCSQPISGRELTESRISGPGSELELMDILRIREANRLVFLGGLQKDYSGRGLWRTPTIFG